MTDIVKRLRAMEPYASNDWKLAREAADEIERLREALREVAALRNSGLIIECDAHAADVLAKVDAAIAKVREE